jgi:hypothetical protein
MNTAFILMAQFGAKAVIPTADVCRDYFPHLEVDNCRTPATGADKTISS